MSKCMYYKNRICSHTQMCATCKIYKEWRKKQTKFENDKRK